jgi:hypothetical protein
MLNEAVPSVPDDKYHMVNGEMIHSLDSSQWVPFGFRDVEVFFFPSEQPMTIAGTFLAFLQKECVVVS